MNNPPEQALMPDEIFVVDGQTWWEHADPKAYRSTRYVRADLASEELKPGDGVNWGNSRLFKNLRKHKIATAYSNDEKIDAQFIVYESDLILLALQLDRMSSNLSEAYYTIDRMNAEKEALQQPAKTGEL